MTETNVLVRMYEDYTTATERAADLLVRWQGAKATGQGVGAAKRAYRAAERDAYLAAKRIHWTHVALDHAARQGALADVGPAGA